MAEELYPTMDVPEELEETEEEAVYKKSVQWDMKKGDFVLDGNNRMIPCSGTEAFKTWCYKIVHTERDSCIAYINDIGVELEEALKEPDNEAVESALERTITEALMINPLTEYVSDFTFIWIRENVFCSFAVKGIETDEFIIETEF